MSLTLLNKNALGITSIPLNPTALSLALCPVALDSFPFLEREVGLVSFKNNTVFLMIDKKMIKKIQICFYDSSNHGKIAQRYS